MILVRIKEMRENTKHYIPRCDEILGCALSLVCVRVSAAASSVKVHLCVSQSRKERTESTRKMHRHLAWLLFLFWRCSFVAWNQFDSIVHIWTVFNWAGAHCRQSILKSCRRRLRLMTFVCVVADRCDATHLHAHNWIEQASNLKKKKMNCLKAPCTNRRRWPFFFFFFIRRTPKYI